MSATRDAIQAQTALIEKAKAVNLEYIIPNGITAEEAMRKMIEIFDCPEQRNAQSLAEKAMKELC